MIDQASTIVTTRVFDATRERLFAAFSDPEQLARWWGPEGFTNTITAFEFREGGKWDITMHGPDGTDYQNESEFSEILHPERIVFDHLGPYHHYRMVMTFSKEDEGKSRLRWDMTFDTDEHTTEIRGFVERANEQNFDRLEALIAAGH